MKTYRYVIGGYEGDQLQPIVRAILNDADAHPLRRVPLRELVEELYKHTTAFDSPMCGEGHVVGDEPRDCFACLDHHFEQVQKQRDALTAENADLRNRAEAAEQRVEALEQAIEREIELYDAGPGMFSVLLAMQRLRALLAEPA